VVPARKHKVEQGECISSIAFEYGFFPDTIWNDPANAGLRRDRQNGNVLCPGDVVTIPALRVRKESCATNAVHCFVRKGVPEILRLVLLDRENQPRAKISYVLTIDGVVCEGFTDGRGELRQPIPPNAMKGTLLIRDEREEEEVELLLGWVDPVTEVSGIQARLSNLGFNCGPVDGNLGPRTQSAIAQFQRQNDLQPSGEPDEATRKLLRDLHGS